MLPGVLELKSVRNGHVVIRGKSSSLFLCMDSRGHLWGQVHDKHKLNNAGTFILVDYLVLPCIHTLSISEAPH